MFPHSIPQLFEKEIYVWSKFRHENVARLLGYAFDNYGYPLLISEWMENGNAWEFVTKNIHFDVLPLVGLVCQVLQIMELTRSRSSESSKG